MLRGLGVRGALLVVVAAACVAATVLIVLVALHTSPIADDYGDLAQIDHSGAFQYLHSYWLNLTDRYSDAAFMLVLIKLFGAAAIHIATPLLTGILFCSCAVAVRAIARHDSRGFGTVVAAAVSAIAIVGATPSIFDTLGWFNAVAIYLAGVVAAAATVAWMARLAVRPACPGVVHVAASFVIGLIAAGFTELVGIVLMLAALLAVANVRSVCAAGPRTRALVSAYTAISAGATVGVGVIFLGPGSRSRLHFQGGGLHIGRLLASLRLNMAWLQTFRWDALACAAAGVLLFSVRNAPIRPRTARWLAGWCVFLLLVPMFTIDASVAYAGGIVAAPPRTEFVAMACMAAAVAILAYLATAAVLAEHPRMAPAVIAVSAAAFLLAVAGLGSATAPVLRAEQLRQAAVRVRAASIRSQIALHRRAIWVTPAPLIIYDASAFDLTFHHRRQYIYVLAGLRQYYGIPSGTALRVVARQPRDYCLPDVVVPWAGVESCEQLTSKKA